MSGDGPPANGGRRALPAEAHLPSAEQDISSVPASCRTRGHRAAVREPPGHRAAVREPPDRMARATGAHCETDRLGADAVN